MTDNSIWQINRHKKGFGEIESSRMGGIRSQFDRWYHLIFVFARDIFSDDE